MYRVKPPDYVKDKAKSATPFLDFLSRDLPSWVTWAVALFAAGMVIGAILSRF